MVGERAFRVCCAVPFCGFTCAGEPGDETLCWQHAKRVPLPRRKAYDRAVAETVPGWFAKRRRRPRWMIPRPARVASAPRPDDALQRLWDRLKREAIERAL